MIQMVGTDLGLLLREGQVFFIFLLFPFFLSLALLGACLRWLGVRGVGVSVVV